MARLCALALALGLTASSSGQAQPSQIREGVAAVAAIIEKEYFDEVAAAAAARTLRAQLTAGRYDTAPTLEALAADLTKALFELTRDKHLAVRVARPAASSAPVRDRDADRLVRGRRENFGVQRIEVLEDNVGYLNIRSFYRLEEARDTIASAMRVLAHADALILDVRENGGGSPDTVAFLASYLFSEPRLTLFEIVPRGERDGTPYRTPDIAPAEANGQRPVLVLTSARTFSAGEGLAFVLQERKRATVVGEVTAGAANPGRGYDAGPFVVTVPNGRVRTAITGGNWEGSGVKPDISVPASSALQRAHQWAIALVKAQRGGIR